MVRLRQGVRLGAYGPLLAMALAGPAIAADCADLLPGPDRTPAVLRQVTAEDLIGLRDIGPASPGQPAAQLFSVSPDGRLLAFQLRRADAQANTYCFGMVVIDILTGKARLVDRGGEFIRQTQTIYGLADSPSGAELPVVPRWSIDGQEIAYLRRDKDVTQVWLARADGSGARRVTAVDFDVENVAWTANGKGLVFNGKPALSDASAKIAAEGRTGYLYDARWVPAFGNHPYPLAPIAETTYTLSLVDGTMKAASASEANLLIPPGQKLSGTSVSAATPDGAVAWSESTDRGHINAPSQLHVRRDGMTTVCSTAVCDGAVSLWWSQGDLYFLKREVRRPQMGLYRWTFDSAAPVQILKTEDVLLGCQGLGDDILCARESSLRPRSLVTIDGRTGASRVLFDPNPEFSGIMLGTVRRLRWINANGIETFGDLVMPPDHRTGETHPLIVVGYDSRGFLRGGTGDDYPIQLFAARGFAVLSFQRPPDYGYIEGAATVADAERLNRVGWADRLSVLSSLETGVQMAIDTGAVDSAHMGITGFSDGVGTVQFALTHDHLFTVAAISNCCEDPTSVMTVLGPTFANIERKEGYPALTYPKPDFWQPFAFSSNAANMKTPILMQVPDSEYLYSLPAYMALKEADVATELYVFPGEYHIKSQPAHRLAIYQRSLDWFDFWLKGEIDPDPAKADQYARWKPLVKASRTSATALSPTP